MPCCTIADDNSQEGVVKEFHIVSLCQPGIEAQDVPARDQKDVSKRNNAYGVEHAL